MSPESGNFPRPTASNRQETPDFEALMRREGPKIYSLAVRLTGNAADGEELAQDAFVAAYKHFGQFRGESEFGTWVYRICVNLWKNRVRYEKRRFFFKHVSLNAEDDDAETPPLQIADPSDVTEKPAEAAERGRLVEEALGRLEPDQRAVLVMRDVDDKSYDEIAEILGVPLGTVKSRINRAREEMKRFLKPLLE